MEPVVLVVGQPWDGLGIACHPGDRLVLWHDPSEGVVVVRVARPDYGAVLAAVNAGTLTPLAAGPAAVVVDRLHRAAAGGSGAPPPASARPLRLVR